jgi:hypothetical protein
MVTKRFSTFSGDQPRKFGTELLSFPGERDKAGLWNIVLSSELALLVTGEHFITYIKDFPLPKYHVIKIYEGV